MLKNFFAKDNATAKLSSWLILATSILTFVCSSLALPPFVSFIILGIVAILTVIAHFFQSNPVVKASSWLVLAYMIVDATATYLVIYPDASQIMLTIAGVLKLVTSFSSQTTGDLIPPTTLTSK